MNDNRITFRSVLLGAVSVAWFATLAVRLEWKHGNFTGTQIPILPYLLLLGLVLGLNPLLRWIRVFRPFSRVEILVVFVMGMVSAGIPTLGLASHLIPVMSGVFTEANNSVSRWDLYVEPYLNESWFVGSQEGLKSAAERYRDADEAWRRTRDIHTSARTLRLSQDAVRSAAEDLHGLTDSTPVSQRRAVERRLRSAQIALTTAEDWWAQYAGEHTVDEVLEKFPAKVDQLQEEQKQRKQTLAAFETNAFLIVSQFRRGLPAETKQAVPGFLPQKGDNPQVYAGRVRRLVYGLRARRQLQEADALLEAETAGGVAAGPAAADLVRSAIALLEPVASTNEVSSRKVSLDRRRSATEGTIELLAKQSSLLNRYLRYAPVEEIEPIRGQLKEIDRSLASHKKELDRVSLDILLLKKEMTPLLRLAETRGELEEIRLALLEAPVSGYGALRERLQKAAVGFASFDASLRRFWVGDVPWRVWARPILNWTFLILTTYVVLMTFNILIFRQWAHNEKIIYPLAELPEMLVGARGIDGGADGILPPIFRNGLFWAGAAISIGVLGWNAFVAPNLSAVGPIPLEWYWEEYIKGSVLDGLRPYTRFRVFFTLIGLTFLVPARISYSLWFFHIVHMVQLLVLVWLGYGVYDASFPTDWSMVSNFTTAQGGGALLIFSTIMLWKSRAYLLCGMRPSAVSHLESAEQSELRWSSWLFLISSVVFVLTLHIGLRVHLFYAVLYYVIILAVTIGLIRAVAEGGLLSFKCWFSPFHFIHSMFGMNSTWTAPALFAPLFVFHSVLFMAYEAYIAPAMANAIKIRDDLRMRRLSFHAVVGLAILIALAGGILTHIIRAYDWGADSMHYWFYRGVPFEVFENVKKMTMTNPMDTQGARWWMLSGAGLMTLLMYFRGRVFWLPHPLGLVMFVNPWMNAYWSSILLGWMFKTLVSKYGNKDTYARLRYLFIGLVVGEIVMCVTGQALDTVWFWAR